MRPFANSLPNPWTVILTLTVLHLAMLSTSHADIPPPEEPLRIIAFGDSLTAGYNLARDKAWPALLEYMLNEANLPATVVNAGISGDSSTGGSRRIGWTLRKPVDIFILALGANDALRGSSPDVTQRNLQAIIDAVKAAYPEAHILIAGMLAPPNLGEDYQQAFAKIYPQLAESNQLPLLPFLLEGVAGDPELNLSDGIHPNEEGQQVVARLVMKHLLQMLDEPSPCCSIPAPAPAPDQAAADSQ